MGPITRNDFGPPEAQPHQVTPLELRLATEKIDQYYDSLLDDGMDADQAMMVERERAAAHQRIQNALMDSALAGFRRG